MNDNFKSFFPSIAGIFFVTIFLTLSFSTGRRLLDDADTGYHIRAGEFIMDTLSIPRHDIFSFISPPLPWTAHEWLSEVIMALVHKAGGLTGVVVLFSFVIAAVYYLLFKIIQTYKGNIVLAASVVSLVIVSSLLHWLARPHIFSLLLMVPWYYLLDTYQYKDKNHLYLLPPIMLLWVNLHGGFISGFVLIGVYLVGDIITFITSRDSEREKFREKVKVLSLATAACFLIALINPYGYKILLFPFRLVSDEFLMDSVQEYLSPNFHGSMPFRYLLFLMIAILAVSKSSLNIIELTLLLLFTHMALYSARYIPLFAIIAAPILLRQAEIRLGKLDGRFIEFFKQRSKNIATIDASTKGYLWPVVSIPIVCIFAASGAVEYKFDEKLKPVSAVEFLKRENPKGNMFNNDEFGDYIIYAAWPKYKVFFDGRSDMYGSSRIKEYYKITRVEPGWEKVIEKYNINWIIYNANAALSMFLMERKDWRLIYADNVANIFVRNIPENEPIIKKYPDVKLPVEDGGSLPSQ